LISPAFGALEDVILDDLFPDVDLALRRGRHIDRDDEAGYAFITAALAHLETLYRRYGCELIHRTDGYYYLLPTGDRLGRRHLSTGEMLVGQALTLLYLDPQAVQQGGTVSRDQVLAQLAAVMGSDALVRALNPKRRKLDERVAEETARAKVAEALRRLSALGFIDLVDPQGVRLRPALMRFAEPVRGALAPERALERLVEAGELVLADGDDGTIEGDEIDDAESGDEAESGNAGAAEADERRPSGEPEERR
jgi:chromosome partition protein MukE